MRGVGRIKNAMAASWNSLRGPTGEQLHELAGIKWGRDITRGYIDALEYIQPQDKVLLYQGGGNYEAYEDLLRDDRVHATFEQRRAAVVSRPWEVVPGGPRLRDRQAADFIKDQLTHLRWDDITNKMLYGIFYGFSVAEVMWGRGGPMVVPTEIRVRNRRRFVFKPGYEDEDGAFALRLLTTENPNGERLPPHKFWVFNTGADNDDEPYGRGLAHWLYWPVWFKKNHIRFWLVYSEKFGAPTPLGKYPKHVTQAEREKLLQAVKAVNTESALAVPDSMNIELIEAKRAGTVDYKAFYEQMNQAITTIVLSQTMTTEDGSSKSQAQVHMDVRKEIVAADAHLVDDSFNRQVANMLTAWNFPGAAPPIVRRVMDDQPNLKQQAERDKLIFDIGGRPTQKYLEETYSIELEDAPAPAPGTPAPADSADSADSADFAEGDADPLEALEQVVDAIDEKEWDHLAAPLILPILNRAKLDPDSIIKDLASLYPEMDTDELENKLARLLFIASLWGRLSEKKKIDEALTPAAAPGRGRDPIPAPGGRDPIPAPGGRDPIPAPGGRGPIPAPDGRDPIPPGRQPGAVPPGLDLDPDAPAPGRDPIPPGRQPGAVPPGREPAPDAPAPGRQPGAVPPGREPAPDAPLPGRQPGAVPPGREPAPDAPLPGRQPGAVPPGPDLEPDARPPGAPPRRPDPAPAPGGPDSDLPTGAGTAPQGRDPVPPGRGGVPTGGVRPPGPLNIGYAVRLTPSRAIDYLREKGFAITFNWWEMWEDAHSKAFTVAKATRLDILETIRAALDKALAEGQTEAQFIKELQPLLEKAGWWGRQTVVSPDGVEQIVQLGSPRRLQTIFRVNMSTAYNAARYRQQMENVDSRPYWKYVAVMDERTRHSHAALHNKVFRYDDPIWDKLYPPNGWNCRCIVVALTAVDLKEQKLEISDSADGLHEISQEVGVNKDTGEVIYRPGTRYDFIDDAGNPQSVTPDPGWSYNPGKTGPRFVNERRASNRASTALQRKTIQSDLNSARFEEAFRKGDVRGWDLAVLPDDVAQALRDRGLKLPGQTVRDGIRPGKLLSDHKEVSVKQYQDLQRALDQGGVYLQAPGKGGKKYHSLLAEYQDGNGQWWLYAINAKNMRTKTIFESGPQHRIHKLNQPDMTLIKEWDLRRWEEK